VNAQDEPEGGRLTVAEAIALAAPPGMHPGSLLNDLGECASTAQRQAEALRANTRRIRELIAERDSARADAELARLRAAEFAERAGVADEEQAALLDWERRLLTQYDRRNHALEASWSGVLALRWEMVQGVSRQGWHPTPEELDTVLEEIARLADRVGLLSGKPGPRELKQVRKVFDTSG
jgi:hypothetical protein